ncbi:MAG TPA: DUF2207 domain-containing protein [Candidatus Moranbacteria bacterium]|nr:DUF2207 domain-containing protein [Candidatus Moranbacteria bacterium]
MRKRIPLKQGSSREVLMLLFLSFIFFASPVFARENIADCYIKSFDSEITVNQDGSLLITEKIVVDCGDLPNKHGIFRVLPTKIKVEERGLVEMPIKLISIEDQTGRKYKYSTERNFLGNTIFWKIGDPEKTVTGENVYIIQYQVKNTLRFWNKNFDEFYWNLTGNFWEMEMDQVRVKIIFPKEINKENSAVWLYSGAKGERENQFADYTWTEANILEVKTNQTLPEKQGVTISVSFPKGILTYRPLPWWEKNWQYLFFLIPLAGLIFCFQLWQRYGKDLKIKKARIAEYEPPQGLSILELGRLRDGYFKNNLFTAEIIYFATKGILTIREVENGKLSFKKKDYELTRLKNKEAEKSLTSAEQKIVNNIFKTGSTKKISELKNNFHEVVSEVKKDVLSDLEKNGYLEIKGQEYQAVFAITGVVLILLAFWLLSEGWLLPAIALILTGVVFLIFMFIMPKITEKGAEVNYQLDNFKLFMKTVDKERARFYEKENIFEKFLPYAIFFGITDLWIKRMKDIYGEEGLSNQLPVWYIGGNLDSFDFKSFDDSFSKVVSSVGDSTSSYSGSGGSGSSGGGGGGGGGGSW